MSSSGIWAGKAQVGVSFLSENDSSGFWTILMPKCSVTAGADINMFWTWRAGIGFAQIILT